MIASSCFIPVHLDMDRFGCLYVSLGHGKEGFYQREDDIEAILDYTDISQEGKDDLLAGYTVHCLMYDQAWLALVENLG